VEQSAQVHVFFFAAVVLLQGLFQQQLKLADAGDQRS
jgi:hypothetical protein